MIEAVDVCPGLGGVAGFAAEGCAVGAPASHAIVELTFVGILVTGGAGAIFKMERKNFVVVHRGRPCGNPRREPRRELRPAEI